MTPRIVPADSISQLSSTSMKCCRDAGLIKALPACLKHSCCLPHKPGTLRRVPAPWAVQAAVRVCSLPGAQSADKTPVSSMPGGNRGWNSSTLLHSRQDCQSAACCAQRHKPQTPDPKGRGGKGVQGGSNFSAKQKHAGQQAHNQRQAEPQQNFVCK